VGRITGVPWAAGDLAWAINQADTLDNLLRCARTTTVQSPNTAVNISALDRPTQHVTSQAARRQAMPSRTPHQEAAASSQSALA
jgi:hypothetical protein